MSGGLAENSGDARLGLVISAIALSASLLVCLLALVPQWNFGSLTAPRAGSEARPPGAQAIDGAADAESYVRRLRAHLDHDPSDARAWVLFARLQAEAGHFAEAAQAYEKALALPSKVARDAGVWCEFADSLGMMQGGRLAGRPRELIQRALELNPNHPKALEMAGSAAYGLGDYVSALRYWQTLLLTLGPGSQAHAELAAAIERAERLAARAPAATRH